MRTIDDDEQVKALCERLGCWPPIAASIARGCSGVVSVGNWVIGYYTDGLAAIEADSPLQAAEMALVLSHKTLNGGPRGVRLEQYQRPMTH